MASTSEHGANSNSLGNTVMLGTDTELETALENQNLLPSQDMITQRQRMFELVKGAVQQDADLETRLHLPFVVVPIGSYGLGVWDSSSSIDCLVIGTISPSTFFTLTLEKLRQPEFQEKGLRVKTASDKMLELKVDGVHFYLRYCAATRVTESWPKALELPSSDEVFELPMESLLKLNFVRDLDYLQRTIPHLAAFRMAYRAIEAWAKNRGIYSAKFGYLGGIHITLLLSHACKRSFAEVTTISTWDIIRTFFRHYADFDWNKDMVYDPTYYTKAPIYHRSYREHLVILSVHSPKVNVAQTATVSSVRTLEEEFKRADRLISTPGVTWNGILGTASEENVSDNFLNAYSNYMKVNVQYWGGAAAKGRRLIRWLESSCVSLLVDINRQFPDIHARIWPGLFTKMQKGSSENEEEYQGCFLIGLAKNDTISDRRSAYVSLLALLETFTQHIRSNETYYDEHYLFADIAVVGQSEVAGLRLDDGFNSAHTDERFDSDDVFEESNVQVNNNKNNKRLQNPRVQPLLSAHDTTGGPKLRPADDVLNRLRWDPTFDSADYVIGYVDRFVGEMEVPISLWKSEQTHEEFIPMHRVLYFKRKSDGQRVWDRHSRVDVIFNTGASGSAIES